MPEAAAEQAVSTPAPAQVEAAQAPANFRAVDGEIESVFRSFEANSKPPVQTGVPIPKKSDPAPVAEPEAAAEEVESEDEQQAAPAPNANDGVIEMLKAQNQELISLVREMSQGRQPAPAQDKNEPNAQEQRSAILNRVKEKLGLTDEEAEAHLSIIEDIADAKARPAIEEAKRVAQQSKQREGQEVSTRARNEATKIISEAGNAAVYGSAEVPFASLTAAQQNARVNWLKTADAMQVGFKQMGVDIDPEKVIRMAHFAVNEDRLTKQAVAAEFGAKASAAQSRRTVSPSDARAAVSASPKVTKGKIAVDANDDARINSVLDQMLGRTSA